LILAGDPFFRNIKDRCLVLSRTHRRHWSRLIDDKEVVVFVEDIQRFEFRSGRCQ
jgi:hypothetical protein